jgi:hypothetical protein
MALTPDTKDWTWVLERPCAECGFDARNYPKETIGPTVREDSAAWDRVLSRDDAREDPTRARGPRSSTPATFVTCSGSLICVSL